MEINDAAAAFSALGQDTRLELLRTLLSAGPEGMSAGDAAGRLEVPASTLSFHLRGLEQSQLIVAKRQGRNLIYAAQIDRVAELVSFLVQPCCSSEPSRCGEFQQVLRGISEEKALMTARRFNVLFLCTRNSARSIIAEAILNELAPDRFLAYSAGSDPAPEGPIPEVLDKLKALGHDVSKIRSKSWSEFSGHGAPEMDFVITLCDTIAGQACPDFGATIVTAAWPMPDPAKFTGSAIERATLLNELYAGLRRRLQIFASLPVASLDRIALKARIDELASPLAAMS